MKVKSIIRIAAAVALGGFLQTLAALEVVVLEPDKDNTLYEPTASGQINSNGMGQYFFSGRVGDMPSGEEKLRRAVISFDVAGAIPSGALIVYAGLRLELDQVGPGVSLPVTVNLHRLSGDWGEGASIAPSPEGQGGPAQTNDATWLHRFYDSVSWTTPGGDFDSLVSAGEIVFQAQAYDWVCSDTNQMLADVQAWLDTPASNFGWLLKMANESPSLTFTALRFISKDHPTADKRPKLTVAYLPAENVLQDSFETPAWQCQ